MTLPSQSPRSSSPLSTGTTRRVGGGTRSLLIAVAALGLGGAAAGWLLTHRSETPDAHANAGTVVDPLATNAAGGTDTTGTISTDPAAQLGSPATTGTSVANAAANATAASATAGIAGTPGTAPTTPTANLGNATQRVQQAVAMVDSDPVRARAELTRLLDSNQLSAAERQQAYAGINKLAEKLFFSAKIVPGDVTSQSYVVKRGDSLARIAKNEKLGVDWRFIQRINGMASEKAVRPDMRLKLAHGPFDVEVVKADFRLNLYSGTGTDRVMVASFPCGLGTNDSTPVGTFKVRAGSKLINPEWNNPHTGEHFAADNPQNPIGERWIGLQGTTPDTTKFTGYGIHGTTEPQSIGKQMSMGCVRLGDAEVQVVYELVGEQSNIVIR
jgi:lipoprotein-anchoring transpeptidase ErfK/SrfK